MGRPLIYRGLYYVPLFLGMMLLAVLMSRQWIVHEKLQYPIASMMLDMVREAPEGRRFNALFTNRRMWLGAGVVMAIHLVKGLHAVFPKVPDIPLGYNLNAIFTEGFWFYLYWYFKVNNVYFTMVGVAFLMSTQVSLSLWFFLVLYCFIAAAFLYQGVSPFGVIHQQTYGAVLAMGGMMLFLARAHLWRAWRVAFFSVRDRRDLPYRSYRWVVWGLMLCLAAAIIWQWTTGLPLSLAVAQVTMVFVSNLVLARIVAETGMFFVSGGGAGLFWVAAPESHVLWYHNVWPAARGAESLMPYAFNALWLRHAANEQQPQTGEEPPGHAISGGFIGVMVAAMLISMVVSAAVWIAIYYSEGLVRTNEWIGIGWSINICKSMARTLESTTPGSALPSIMHIATGAVMVVLLGICRWRIPRWPFVPIVLCMGMSNEMGFMWFSIFIGWACKSLVMRTGGVLAYQRLRPMFLGMIFGELFMAGAWMAFGAFVKLQGLPISPYRILPTH